MSNPYETPKTSDDLEVSEVNEGQKKRHGCLTAYLIFMLIANAGVSLVYLSQGSTIEQNANLPSWAVPTLALFGIFNLVCAIALFKWKKWGFYGFVGSALIVTVINYICGLGVQLGGFIGIAILYGVLQIGKKNKGWNQLD